MGTVVTVVGVPVTTSEVGVVVVEVSVSDGTLFIGGVVLVTVLVSGETTSLVGVVDVVEGVDGPWPEPLGEVTEGWLGLTVVG